MPRSALLRHLSARPVVNAAVAGLAACLAVLGSLGITAASYGVELREDARLLPGTTIAGVDVGDLTVDQARVVVEDALAARLDRPLTVRAGERRWTTSARDLGARTDLDAALDSALARTVDANLATLARVRFTGWVGDHRADVGVTAGEPEVARYVRQLAAEIDRPVRDAVLTWTDDRFDVATSRTGLRLDPVLAREALAAAVADDASTVELIVEETAPDVDTEAAQAAAATITPLVNEALDRPVRLILGDRSWSTTPREVAAVPDTDPLVAAALTGQAPAGVGLAFDDDRLDAVVDAIAAEVHVPARDADATWRDGTLHLTGEQAGRALVRDGVRDALVRALRGDGQEVTLATRTVQPALTTASFDRYLVVDQAERRLYYYRDGERVREWPVAVGLAGSPTPTGLFTVGAKRFEPTWVNPSPQGWGRDMPARIGPGPDNPLGLRALNWNRNGRDTLIRFHGTPNESSIGEAASRGCVRMFNADVIELYDLIPSGTPILSVR